MILKGKCVCSGFAEGRIHLVDDAGWLATALARGTARDPQAELDRFEAAGRCAALQLERVRNLLVQRGRAHDAEIFAAHATLLRDGSLQARIEVEIRERGQSAEAAVARVAGELRDLFEQSEHPSVRDKAQDVLDVGRRLVQSLGDADDAEAPSADVVVAGSLMPSELVHYAHHGVVAVITETCGPKSHTAILARGLAIPMVTGIDGVVKKVRGGAPVLIDAGDGLVVVDPGPQDDEAVRRIRAAREPRIKSPRAPLPSATRDGVVVRVLLNISDPIEAECPHDAGLAGVGLFRTEFLYMDRDGWPTEDENFEAYERVARALGDRELNIRLADFGAEKCPAYADIPVNRNPSLGIRGVRLLLARPDILEPQVRALARLARLRTITVLLPMIDTLDTLRRIRGELERICGTGPAGRLPFQLATMIEVPAAALLIDDLIGEVDAVSVGLNDLTQYLLAADRDDESVESYHDALQPVVLRLLRRLVEVADNSGKPVTMCGELAGDPKLTPLLLALGVRRISVSRSHLEPIGTAIAELSVGELGPLGTAVLRCTSGRDVRALLQSQGML